MRSNYLTRIEDTFPMRTFSHTLDRVGVVFDDDRLVANAGLILPATLAEHLGLRKLFEEHVDLGDAPGHANVGHKAMTVVHAVLADADSIDDCDVLPAGATAGALGRGVSAPQTAHTHDRPPPPTRPQNKATQTIGPTESVDSGLVS